MHTAILQPGIQIVVKRVLGMYRQSLQRVVDVGPDMDLQLSFIISTPRPRFCGGSWFRHPAAGL